MKKVILKLLFIFTLCVTTMITVNAETTYYTNKNGIEMTKEQYNKLLENNPTTYIENMTQEDFNFEISSDIEYLGESTKYIKDTYLTDGLGNVLGTISEEVTEEEYENYDTSVSTASSSLETNMKKISIVKALYNGDYRYTLTATWKSVPKVRSYDVIAMRWGYGKQYSSYDGQQDTQDSCVYYSQGGTNSKTDGTGVGISMNLVDDATSLTLYLRVYFDLAPTTVYGAYEHATSAVTLAQSQNYTFNSSGMGGVLYFNSSVSSYYDNTAGVSI